MAPGLAGPVRSIARPTAKLAALVHAIRSQIEARSRQAFGNVISDPDYVVTELVNSAPEKIGIAPDLVGTPTCGPPASTTSRHRA